MNIRPEFFLYLLVMAGVTYLIRVLPILFVRHKIENKFLRSFLYYVPYTVLTVMSFPTILFCTGNIASGICAMAVCIILAYLRRGMVTVAIGGAVSVLVCECIIRYLA